MNLRRTIVAGLAVLLVSAAGCTSGSTVTEGGDPGAGGERGTSATAQLPGAGAVEERTTRSGRNRSERPGWTGCVVEVEPEFGEGGGGQVGQGLADRGQRRRGQIGQHDVVEADHRDVAADLEAGVPNGAADTDGGHVVDREDRGRSLPPTQQSGGRPGAQFGGLDVAELIIAEQSGQTSTA